MPKVGKGDKAADFPYTKEGMEAAEDYSQQTNQEIDYSPGGEANAPDMRESYQLGGQIPGQPGFGQRPAPVAPIGLGQKPEGLQPQGNMGNVTEGIVKSGIMEPIPRYKKGGKVKKYGGGTTD